MTTTASVFLSTERLAELRRQAQVPETWYVHGYYRDAAGHYIKKAARAVAGHARDSAPTRGCTSCTVS